ncbi:MAG: ROK family protein [Verrucomicrobiota bacterium]|nr:ROK family protein [Verrucomicrobiota bacterium]
MSILGWDIGGTKSAIVVGDASGGIHFKHSCRVSSHAPAGEMIDEFISVGSELAQKFSFELLGVSVGGPLNSITGEVLTPPHLPGWKNVPLKKRLEEALALPVSVQHDAAACLYAEHLWGAAKNCSDAIYLTLGTGCGAGVMVRNKILVGPRGESPEVGHIRLADDGPEAFGKAGCVESFCSGSGIIKFARWKFPQKFSEIQNLKELVERLPYDRDAVAVIDLSAKKTGQLCALLADLFSPQVILLGSLSWYLGEVYVQKVINAFQLEVLPGRVDKVRILRSGLESQLQDLSAIAAALMRTHGR